MPTTVTPISGPKRSVTPTDDGNIIFLGNASENRVGCFAVQFEPAQDWVGSLVVLGRIYTNDAKSDNAAFHTVPYRAAFLNGTQTATPYGWAADAITGVPLPITGSSLLQIPADGWCIAFMVACTAGSAVLYSMPMDGPSVV